MLKASVSVVGVRAEKEEQGFAPDARVSSEVLAFVVKQHGMKQRQIAAILNVHFSYVSKVLKGQRNLTLAHIEAVSKALNIPMPVLLWNALRPKASSAHKRTACDGIDQLFREVYPDAAGQQVVEVKAARNRLPGSKRRLAAAG